MTRVMDSSQATGMTRLVLLVIANHETEERGAFPSVHTIGREANCSDRAVQDAITRAKQMGELDVSYRSGPNGTNVYRTLCGTRGAAPLPVVETRESAGVQNLRGADVRRESAPELKELSSTVSTSLSPSEVLKSGATRSRDELYELMYLAQTGHPYEPKARIGGRERSKINTATADVKSAGFTPDEIRLAITGWPVAMGDANITALGLSANLTRCIAAAEGASFRKTQPRETEFDRARSALTLLKPPGVELST